MWGKWDVSEHSFSGEKRKSVHGTQSTELQIQDTTGEGKEKAMRAPLLHIPEISLTPYMDPLSLPADNLPPVITAAPSTARSLAQPLFPDLLPKVFSSFMVLASHWSHLSASGLAPMESRTSLLIGGTLLNPSIASFSQAIFPYALLPRELCFYFLTFSLVVFVF